MLDEVHIQSLGVIEDVTLRLGPGLTVLTGETGAGKTMVVEALQLLAGVRADSSLVRAGAERAYVEARLVPPPPEAGDWCDEDAEDLVISRELPASGGSRARIDGRLAPVSALGDVVGGILEVHAQHEHHRLTDPAVQRRLLDRFAGEPHARVLRTYRETYAAWRDATEALERLEADARERARELDRLQHEVNEIESAGLDPEQDGALEVRLDRLEHAEDLQLALAEASASLSVDSGAGDALGTALGALRRVQVDDPDVEQLRDRAADLVALASDLAADARDLAEEVQADPAMLDELRARQRLVSGLIRKYGEDVEAVLGYADRARHRMDELSAAEAESSGLADRVVELRADLDRFAGEVSQGRLAAAGRLAEVVASHLADLAMPHARMEISIDSDGEPGPDGVDRVTFLLAANPGEPAVPVGKAASGGERSRVALAVEVALADVDDVQILVFDEVDAGVGGQTAMAVGQKLARLATPRGDGPPRQVLCVTHLAQLAAFADAHHVVEKGIAGGRTVTTARRVDDEERAPELARMLGGEVARDAGVAHARALLAEAGERRRAG